MNQLFLHTSSRRITYGDLFDDIRDNPTWSPIIATDDIYETFRTVIVSLLLDHPVTIYDESRSEAEADPRMYHLASIESMDDLLHRIQSVKNWRIDLFTSGTTGLPKRISHRMDNLIRSVSIDKRHGDDVWGFCYSARHIAGLQVFLQAILNGNPLIELFKLPRDEILSRIESDGITHVSATPTFYRMLLPCDRAFDYVRRITFGGEKLDESLQSSLRTVFPNAKFTNIYASTEAGTILNAEGSWFRVRPELTGKIRINNDELQIHKSLMGNSDSIELDGDWYSSGDIVEIDPDDPGRFRFKYRKNEMINVGGFKVNPHEVEDALRRHPAVRNAQVYGSPNRITGNILCCRIEATEPRPSERDIRAFLEDSLTGYMIPRIIDFTDNLETTTTGKLRRT